MLPTPFSSQDSIDSLFTSSTLPSAAPSKAHLVHLLPHRLCNSEANCPLDCIEMFLLSFSFPPSLENRDMSSTVKPARSCLLESTAFAKPVSTPPSLSINWTIADILLRWVGGRHHRWSRRRGRRRQQWCRGWWWGRRWWGFGRWWRCSNTTARAFSVVASASKTSKLSMPPSPARNLSMAVLVTLSLVCNKSMRGMSVADRLFCPCQKRKRDDSRRYRVLRGNSRSVEMLGIRANDTCHAPEDPSPSTSYGKP